jgi:Predicted RNA binding protein (contains ribosomal protein S1 domain)
MTIEVGTKVDGKVSGITNFGAFIDLGENRSGLVHISEVSDGFIKDIHDVLNVGDTVKVKVLSIADDGKIALSIRKAVDHPVQKETAKVASTSHHSNGNFHGRPAGNMDRKYSHNQHSHRDNHHFDQMLSGFLKDSESRLSTLKRNTDGKRGGRGGRRS